MIARRLLMSALVAAGLVSAACGDDGKAHLYESCNASLPCSEGLACLSLVCTHACVVELPAGTTPQVGDCRGATECEDDVVGCCLLNLVEGQRGQGNCTVSPP